MADVKYQLEDTVKHNFLDPITDFQNNELKDFNVNFRIIQMENRQFRDIETNWRAGALTMMPKNVNKRGRRIWCRQKKNWRNQSDWRRKQCSTFWITMWNKLPNWGLWWRHNSIFINKQCKFWKTSNPNLIQGSLRN